MEAMNESKLVYLSVNELYPHPDNPRKELGDLTELADSIKAKGVLQNLTVVPYQSKTKPGKKFAGYTVIIGHRRLAAAKLAGVDKLPCVIVQMDEREQMETMLLENLQRVDLTLYEQAKGFQLMMELGRSVSEIVEKTGFSETTVRRRLKLATLEDATLREAAGRQVSMADIDKLFTIEDEAERNKVAKSLGTVNFDMEIRRANEKQAEKERFDAWREHLRGRGFQEISSGEIFGNKRFDSNVTGSERMDRKPCVPEGLIEQADGRQIYFGFYYGWVYFRAEKRPESEAETDAEREEREAAVRAEREEREAAVRAEQKDREERYAKLREEFKMAYELRAAFIKTVTEAKCRAAFADVMRYAAKGGAWGDWEDFAACVGIDLEEIDEDGDAVDLEYEDVAPELDAFAAAHPYRTAAVIAYMRLQDSDREMCTVRWNDPRFEENRDLCDIYGFLGCLGYEMSDTECALLCGKHELYTKE